MALTPQRMSIHQSSDPPQIQFCSQCGTALQRRQRVGGLRPNCPQCGWTYFPDPKVAVGVLVERDGAVLLVRRVMEPEQGKWTLPGGFLDAGEDPQDTARRECMEETNLDVRITGLLKIISGQEHPRGAHLVLIYTAEIQGGELEAGDDADKAGFFTRDELPPLAFYATRAALEMEE